jgi:phosphoserine phosphatase RsbU/P
LAQRVIDVLLIEDNFIDARLVRDSLVNEGETCYRLLHVTCLAEGLVVISSQQVDCVLLDLNLPDSSGMDTLMRVRAEKPDLPIVVLTGLDDPPAAERAVEMGAQDYLVKDVLPSPQVARALRYAMARVAASLENRTLLLRLAEERKRLHMELNVARGMQLQLLPRPERLGMLRRTHALDIRAVFEPSSLLGGDLWGCLEVGLGRIGLYAFDFSGHGIAAALNTFRLHTLIDDHKELHGDPWALITKVGDALESVLPCGQYATFFYGIIDVVDETLTWVGAASPPPILVCPDGAVEMLEAHGLPLGVRGDAERVVRTRPFPPGASLFVYSDALSEAPTAPGQGESPFMTEEGVTHMVVRASASLPEERLTNLMRDFAGRVCSPLEDDLTAIWVSRL